MRPTAGQLARRDPALAAIFGIVAASGQPDNFGADFGDDYGADFGDDYGADFGADAPAAPAAAAAAHHATMAKHHAAMAMKASAGGGARGGKRGGGGGGAAAPAAHAAAQVAAWHAQHAAAREKMLDPNAGLSKKIERYTFSINQALVVGTPLAFSITNNPDTTIRPQRVTMNAPTPGFILISEVKVANVSVTVGGILDAFQFSSLGVDESLDMPTLSPANRVSVIGNYTGFISPGLIVGTAYTFVVTFTGPSNLAG